MPRRPRMYIPGLPYHIVQRGNNREACFYQQEDYLCYIELLQDSLHRYGVQLHAYVLMTNHIHFLMTPNDNEGISNLAKVTGSRFAQYMNKRYKRTGSMWEGRHKSSVIDSQEYLLKCSRYIELNPVRAGMVAKPGEYKWSSYRVNAGCNDELWITPHPEYLQLARDREARCKHYRSLFSEILSNQDLHSIRQTSHYCQPLGNDRFKGEIEEKIGRPVGHLKPGRPKK